MHPCFGSRMRHTEYQIEYCGKSGENLNPRTLEGLPQVNSTEINQPVGGRAQRRAREAALARHMAQIVKTDTGLVDTLGRPLCQSAGPMIDTVRHNNPSSLPVIESDHVAQVYSDAERGTHRVQRMWNDPRWSADARFDTQHLYDPCYRDPAMRQMHYMYNTTRMDALNGPSRPLNVPDVHKLRYMHNNYMTKDDWY